MSLESNHLPGNIWVPTDKANDSSAMRELRYRATESLESIRSFNELRGSPISDIGHSFDIDFPDSFYETDDEYLYEVEYDRQKYTQEGFFKKLSRAEQVLASRVLWTPNVAWRVGVSDVDDGLWYAETPKLEVRAGAVSRYVLSGLLGSQLLKADKKLDTIASEFEDSALRRAILVGGAGLAGVTNREQESDAHSYKGDAHDGLRSNTFFTGSSHGDFRSTRYLQAAGEVQDSSVGMSHYFAPAFDIEKVGAYYSVEPVITKGLLYYLVAHAGVDRHQLHNRLMKRVIADANDTSEPLAFFGDFDTQDGYFESAGLYDSLQPYRLNERRPARVNLASLCVLPGNNDTWVRLRATEEGVAFESWHKEKLFGSLYTIPTDEIEDYVATLANATGGRSTFRAHLPVIDALIKNPEHR